MEQIAMIGLCRADPSIPWPPRGSGEADLTPRNGWQPVRMNAVRRGLACEIDGMSHGQLAVNVMMEGEGFAICLASSGYRLSYGGAVFARCEDAMAAAEAMLSAISDWSNCETTGFNDRQRETLRSIIQDAEKRGEILIDRVYPS